MFTRNDITGFNKRAYQLVKLLSGSLELNRDSDSELFEDYWLKLPDIAKNEIAQLERMWGAVDKKVTLGDAMNLGNQRYLRMGNSGPTYLSLDNLSAEPITVRRPVQQHQVASNPAPTYIAPQSAPLVQSITPQKHNELEAASEDLGLIVDENLSPHAMFGEAKAETERNPTILYLSNLSAKDADTSSDLLRFYAKVTTANHKTCSAHTLMDNGTSSRYVDEGYAKSLGLRFHYCGVMKIITNGVKHPPQPHHQVWLDASIRGINRQQR
jgi:hypothetical protein